MESSVLAISEPCQFCRPDKSQRGSSGIHSWSTVGHGRGCSVQCLRTLVLFRLVKATGSSFAAGSCGQGKLASGRTVYTYTQAPWQSPSSLSRAPLQRQRSTLAVAMKPEIHPKYFDEAKVTLSL